MRRNILAEMGITCGVILALSGGAIAADRKQKSVRLEPERFVATYPVADLVIPLPAPKADNGGRPQPKFDALIEHVKATTGADRWTDKDSIQMHPDTLSLVIRQTAGTHELIADELSRLRRDADVQVTLEIRVVSGPRREIAPLAAAFPGELGRYEVEQLQQRINATKALEMLMAPKITLFNGQAATVQTGEWTLVGHAAVAADRRSVRLKIAAGSPEAHDLVGAVQTVDLHDGRTTALRFEAPRQTPAIPQSADATERLVIVTTRILIQDEEEELLAVPRAADRQ